MDSNRAIVHTVQSVLILLFITAHSFLMNGYFHANRFLNVAAYLAPIAAKCDPTLFRNSLYVRSLEEKSARLSLLHDLSPSILCDVDLERLSLVQWCICLLLTIAALFYLGKTLTGSEIAGYGTALLFTTTLNTWSLGSPAIYINFFHHGLQWAILFNVVSLILMLKKRYPLAFFFMGVAWNFHPMSVVFLFLLFFPYWVVHRRACGLKALAVCAACFALPALPLLIKSFSYLTMQWNYGPEWMIAVRWTAWYTVFASTWPAGYFVRAGLFFCLFLMGLSSLPRGEARRDITLLVGTIGILCAVGTVCADLFPVPVIMKLSLWRTSWIYIILALPCIMHLFITLWEKGFLSRFLIIATCILLTGYIHSFPFYYLIPLNLFFFLLLKRYSLERRYPRLYNHLTLAFLTLLALCMGYQFLFERGLTPTAVGLALVFLFLLLVSLGRKFLPPSTYSRPWQTILTGCLFISLLDTAILYHRGGPEIYYHGSVLGERDPWADLQLFARTHSEKDDLFIVPPYINDFSLYSQRATLGDWAEGANILYMDNSFAQQWLERMNDLGWKTMEGAVSGYNGLSTDQIVEAARKYRASYIVTEKPKHFDLLRMYENSRYILYRAPDL